MKYLDVITKKNAWSIWLIPYNNQIRLACCDCGLVHDVKFRYKDNQISFSVRRNNKATAAKRRKRSSNNFIYK